MSENQSAAVVCLECKTARRVENTEPHNEANEMTCGFYTHLTDENGYISSERQPLPSEGTATTNLTALREIAENHGIELPQLPEASSAGGTAPCYLEQKTSGGSATRYNSPSQ